jgi:NADH-quinone oxidoreductase subunit G
MLNLTIDGKPYALRDGLTVIEAIDEAGIQLPRYCYHPGLTVAGNCRICQVEVEQLPRTVIACNTPATSGMVIHTRSQKARKSQEAVLEFLLANHPLDCPVCDQSGECALQDYYMQYGLYSPSFNENKVKKPKKAASIGPTLMLDQERCILCSRCVRFCDEITHTHELGIFERGDSALIDIYPNREVTNKYSGNLADLCPVGALTDKDFRFKCRVWYLGAQKSVCPGCSRGCNITIHYEKSRPYHYTDKRVMRLKPRENPLVNRWWMCDAGRYDYKKIDESRITDPLLNHQPVSWETAIAEAAAQLKKLPRWAIIFSSQMTNEEVFLIKKIFMGRLGFTEAAWAGNPPGDEDSLLIQKDKNPNSMGARIISGATDEPTQMAHIVQQALAGNYDGLLVFQQDLQRMLRDENLKNLRRAVGMLIYEGPNVNATAQMADLVLAGASYAEKAGTFTNALGRVQQIWPALKPLGQSRPTSDVLQQIALRLGYTNQIQPPAEVFLELSRETAAFAGLTYESVGDQGKVLKI